MNTHLSASGNPVDESQERGLRNKKSKRITAGRLAFLVHSFIGLKLSIIFCVVLLSGTIAVFHEEIDWLLYAEKRATAASERMNPGAVYDKLQAQFPESGISSFYTAADREQTAATALKSTSSGGFTVVHIDPYSGEFRGETDFLTVGSFIRILHTNLFMPLIGRAFVNFFGILCLIGLITGLIATDAFGVTFSLYLVIAASSFIVSLPISTNSSGYGHCGLYLLLVYLVAGGFITTL